MSFYNKFVSPVLPVLYLTAFLAAVYFLFGGWLAVVAVVAIFVLAKVASLFLLPIQEKLKESEEDLGLNKEEGKVKGVVNGEKTDNSQKYVDKEGKFNKNNEEKINEKGIGDEEGNFNENNEEKINGKGIDDNEVNKSKLGLDDKEEVIATNDLKKGQVIPTIVSGNCEFTIRKQSICESQKF